MKSKRNTNKYKRSRHDKRKKYNKTQKYYGGKQNKKWKTAIEAAQSTLTRTGSLKKAERALKIQALANARRLFGSVGEGL